MKRVFMLLCTLCSVVPASSFAAQRIAPPLADVVHGFVPTKDEIERGASNLLNVAHVESLGGGKLRHTNYVAIALLSDDAVQDYSQIAVHFNSYYSDAKVDFARVLSRAGEIKELSPDAVQVQTTDTDLSYSDMRALAFSLPTLSNGAYLEFQITTIDTQAIIGDGWYFTEFAQYFQPISRGFGIRIDSTRRAELKIIAPPTETVRWKNSGHNSAPSIVNKDDKRIYQWSYRDLDAVPVERDSKSVFSLIPGINASTIPDWQTLDAWGTRTFRLEQPIAEKIKTLAHSLSVGATSVSTQLHNVHRYVTKNIRYVQADIKRGGFTPHSPEEILNNGYGDCKDQALLTVSLLRAMGIDAAPMLINMRPRQYRYGDLPTVSFDHAIVYVLDEGKPVFIDTTASESPFPGEQWVLADQAGFVLDGRGGKRVIVPETKPEDNSADLHIAYELDGKQLYATIDAKVHGAFRSHLKSIYNSSSDKKEAANKLVNEFFPRGDVTDAQWHVNPNDPGTIGYSGKIDLGSVSPKEFDALRFTLGAGADAFGNWKNLPSPTDRHYDYEIGFPYSVNITTEIKQPTTNHYARVLKKPTSSTDKYFTVAHDLTVDDRAVKSNVSLVMRSQHVPRENYAAFYTAVKNALDQVESTVLFKRDEAYFRNATSKPQSIDTSPKGLLASARDDLSAGNFEQAKEKASQVTTLDPYNGEAHYLLGLSLGFLNDYRGSEQQLATARKLGYKP